MRDKTLKGKSCDQSISACSFALGSLSLVEDFTEQLLKQNQNRHLSRDDPPLEFLLYMFDAIELLRVSVA